jgi:hypothetical protein
VIKFASASPNLEIPARHTKNDRISLPLTVGSKYTRTFDVAGPDPSSPAFAACNPAALGLFLNGTQDGSVFNVGETPGTWTE